MKYHFDYYDANGFNRQKNEKKLSKEMNINSKITNNNYIN